MYSLFIHCTPIACFSAEIFKLSNILHMLSGVDEVLAQHVAHLFIRDPVSLFEEKIQQSIEDDVDHFEVGIISSLCLVMYLSFLLLPRSEYPVDKLAKYEVQASTSQLPHWLES